MPQRPEGGLEPKRGVKDGRDRHSSKSSLRTVVMNQPTVNLLLYFICPKPHC